jgi:hypothetical protein
MDDPMESCIEQGWSGGLPVVPPSELRVVRMMAGIHPPSSSLSSSDDYGVVISIGYSF